MATATMALLLIQLSGVDKSAYTEKLCGGSATAPLPAARWQLRRRFRRLRGTASG